jgi:hypothetical protein
MIPNYMLARIGDDLWPQFAEVWNERAGTFRDPALQKEFKQWKRAGGLKTRRKDVRAVRKERERLRLEEEERARVKPPAAPTPAPPAPKLRPEDFVLAKLAELRERGIIDDEW